MMSDSLVPDNLRFWRALRSVEITTKPASAITATHRKTNSGSLLDCDDPDTNGTGGDMLLAMSTKSKEESLEWLAQKVAGRKEATWL